MSADYNHGMKKVIVVGGGLAGLSVAFRLLGHADVTVLEADQRLGGNIHTTTSPDGFRVEWGPNGFLDGKPSLLQLCRDLGLGNQLLVASEGSRKNRYVFWNDQLTALPASPLGILTTPLLSTRGKFELLAEPLRGRGRDPSNESVTAFATRRLGREACRVFMEALVTGIHAADPEKLSVAAAFPRLVAFEKQHRSVLRGFLASAKAKRKAVEAHGEKPLPQRMWSFRGGLREVIEALRHKLADRIETGIRVKRIVRIDGMNQVVLDGETRMADHVILACPAYEQARLLEAVPGAPSADLAAVEYNSIAVVALGYRVEDAPLNPDGFGYIAPARLKRDAIGVQWCSSIFPDRAPPGFVLWRALCGGALRPDVLGWDDETLLRNVHAEMMRIMKVTDHPKFSQIVRWPRAIPQYHLGHLERVQRIEAALQTVPGIHTAGNSLHGIALNDVVERSNVVAATILGG